MALYENLPVYKAAYDLLLRVYKLCSHMHRTHRYTLGERVQEEMTELMLNIYRANSAREKKAIIQTARENTAAVKLLFRVLHDLDQLSLKQFISVSEQIEAVSKQLAAWGKSARGSSSGDRTETDK